MRQRVTFFMTDQEHAALAAYADRVGLSMSRVIGNAVRAVASGTITVAGDSIIVTQDSGQHTFRMLPPTSVSRETPVPSEPVDTTEYKINPLVSETSGLRWEEDDAGNVFDCHFIPKKQVKVAGVKV